jgi:hypothetical protein
MTVILHIGFHRTDSTAIQGRLRRLAALHAFLVPFAPRVVGFVRHPLRRAPAACQLSRRRGQPASADFAARTASGGAPSASTAFSWTSPPKRPPAARSCQDSSA